MIKAQDAGERGKVNVIIKIPNKTNSDSSGSARNRTA